MKLTGSAGAIPIGDVRGSKFAVNEEKLVGGFLESRSNLGTSDLQYRSLAVFTKSNFAVVGEKLVGDSRIKIEYDGS